MEKKCPYCAETIKAEAIKCRYCFSDLADTPAAQVVSRPPAPPSEAPPKAADPSPSMDEVALRYDAQKKSAGVGYFLWFVLGTLGGHRYYFGRTGSALCMTAGALLFLVSTLVGGDGGIALFGWVILAAIGLWALVDAFLIPGWNREFNSTLVNTLKGGPLGSKTKEGAHKRPAAMPSEPISISICPQCRSQGDGTDEACRRCGHAFA